VREGRLLDLASILGVRCQKKKRGGKNTNEREGIPLSLQKVAGPGADRSECNFYLHWGREKKAGKRGKRKVTKNTGLCETERVTQ